MKINQVITDHTIIIDKLEKSIKLYGWNQMDKNAILREMKRLELQISSLSGKINEHN